MTLCFVSRLWYQNSNHISLSLSRGPSPAPLFARNWARVFCWDDDRMEIVKKIARSILIMSCLTLWEAILVWWPETRDRRRKQYVCVASRANNATMKEGQISQPSPDPDITMPSCLRHIHQRHLDSNLHYLRFIIQQPTSALNGTYKWSFNDTDK